MPGAQTAIEVADIVKAVGMHNPDESRGRGFAAGIVGHYPVTGVDANTAYNGIGCCQVRQHAS